MRSSSNLEKIIISKEAARERLRRLPWIEKLELLDRLRERHLMLRETRVQAAAREEPKFQKSEPK